MRVTSYGNHDSNFLINEKCERELDKHLGVTVQVQCSGLWKYSPAYDGNARGHQESHLLFGPREKRPQSTSLHCVEMENENKRALKFYWKKNSATPYDTDCMVQELCRSSCKK